MKLTLRRPPRPPTQGVFEFRDRSARLDRLFKRGILLATVGLVAATLAASPTLRGSLGAMADRSRALALGWIGLEPSREEIDAEHARARARNAAFSLGSLVQFYEAAPPEMRRLFDEAGMAPNNGLMVTGRADHAFLISSKVFERDDRGRSYRLRPSLRSVWLRQITLQKGPFALLLIPDTPAARAAGVAAGGIVDEKSAQSTNSWGLRGPEPDPAAEVRGIVLGDSFMQGMFVGDSDTPPRRLQEELAARWKRTVSVLNTGHVGYAPEQYLATLREFGAKFPPAFVVVSVCTNDFGGDFDVLNGGGTDWSEAMHNLNEIATWCRAKNAPMVLVPVPTHHQLIGMRRDGRYPGRISDGFQAGPASYLDLLDPFLNEHLRLESDRRRGRLPAGQSALYNLEIADNHFSPTGSALWARLVADRVEIVMRDRVAGLRRAAPPGTNPVSVTSPRGQ